MLDLVSDILTRLSVQGTLYFRTSFTPPWGIAVPAFENVARFHFAHRGDSMISVDGMDEPIAMAQGDLVIIPNGAAHALYCGHEPETTILPLDDVLERSGYDGEGVLVYGGDMDNKETQLICGHFSFNPYAKHVLLARLPPIIHIKNYGEDAGRWMEATLRVIGDEAGRHRMGGDLIALKMSEAILAQAIRVFVESDAAETWGLAGFSNPQLQRALDGFHRRPRQAWTVETLAQSAGMSRTSFAVLFQKKMGMTPLAYVTRWRIELAKEGLMNKHQPLIEVAESVGYASDSAFARVFKKETGHTPAGFRKLATR